MSAETIGRVSGIIVLASVLPYSVRVWQGKVHPNLTSWSLWTLIGLALLLTYKSAGAEASVWPAVFGFFNPLLITALVVWRHGGWKRPDGVEVACIIFGLLSLGLWMLVRDRRELAQYALYLAILADACAAVPTLLFVWTHPEGDRPFAWACFAVGYGLALFAITERTFSNYALPVYMTLGSSSITFPMVLHRLRRRMPLSEWV